MSITDYTEFFDKMIVIMAERNPQEEMLMIQESSLSRTRRDLPRKTEITRLKKRSRKKLKWIKRNYDMRTEQALSNNE